MKQHSVGAVHTRRAYFDCRFGQLHVRTGFPGTGGFDEHPIVLCIHSASTTSRVFAPLLEALAGDRSVYAVDLPGRGESDHAPSGTGAEANLLALQDFARDLRLKVIDIVALDDAAQLAVQWATEAPAMVRKLVHWSKSPASFASVSQPTRCITESVATLEDRVHGAGPFAQVASFLGR